jgi:hypothetical protein
MRLKHAKRPPCAERRGPAARGPESPGRDVARPAACSRARAFNLEAILCLPSRDGRPERHPARRQRGPAARAGDSGSSRSSRTSLRSGAPRGRTRVRRSRAHRLLMFVEVSAGRSRVRLVCERAMLRHTIRFVQPPSALMQVPVIQEAWSEQRNTTSPAISWRRSRPAERDRPARTVVRRDGLVGGEARDRAPLLGEPAEGAALDRRRARQARDRRSSPGCGPRRTRSRASCSG